MAEQARFLLAKFEVGLNGKTACERLKGKSAKVQGLPLAEGILWKRDEQEGQLGKLTCMWEDGLCLGIKATMGGSHSGEPKCRLGHKNGPEETWD